MVELISALIGSAVVFLVLLLVPINMKRKQILLIVCSSFIIAILFNLLMSVYTMLISLLVALFLILSLTILLTLYMRQPIGSETVDEVVEADEELQEENESQQDMRSDDTHSFGDRHLDQSKIDEYIRSFAKQEENKLPAVQQEMVETSTDVILLDDSSLEEEQDYQLDPQQMIPQIETSISTNEEFVSTEWDVSMDTINKEITIDMDTDSQRNEQEIDVINEIDELEELNNIMNQSREIDTIETVEADMDEDEALESILHEDMLLDIEIPNEAEQVIEETGETYESQPSKYEAMLSDVGDFIIEEIAMTKESPTNETDTEPDEFGQQFEKREILEINLDNEKEKQDPLNEEDLIKKRKALFEELEGDLFK